MADLFETLLKSSLVFSLIAYTMLAFVCMSVRNGPIWSLFKAVLWCHVVGTLGAVWVSWGMHDVASPGFTLVSAGRLFGAIGNTALAVAMAREYGYFKGGSKDGHHDNH